MFSTNPITEFPAEGLRASHRFVTSHNHDGEGVFVIDDEGDHHRVLMQGGAVANTIYSTPKVPVDLNDDKDILYARKNEPGIYVPGGSVVRLIDFAPGVESPLHRTMSIDYCVLVEGRLLFTLDSGESKVMLPGDMIVNRGCMHKWTNLDETRPARLVVTVLGVAPFRIGTQDFQDSMEGLDNIRKTEQTNGPPPLVVGLRRNSCV